MSPKVNDIARPTCWISNILQKYLHEFDSLIFGCDVSSCCRIVIVVGLCLSLSSLHQWCQRTLNNLQVLFYCDVVCVWERETGG
jgi:hypothetical protein